MEKLDPEKLSFEDALSSLEQIVSNMESGGLGLDESLKKYEEGIRLSRLCLSRLEKAEAKVEIITRQGGDAVLEDFNPDADSAGPEKGSKRGHKRQTKVLPEEPDTDDQLLF